MHTSKVQHKPRPNKAESMSRSFRVWGNGVSAAPSPQNPPTRLVRPAAAHIQSAPPGVPGPQSVLFCLARCCSWYSLESSQGRGPRTFFHSSKFNSFIFCRGGGGKKQQLKDAKKNSHPIKQFLKSVQDFSTLQKYYEGKKKKILKSLQELYVEANFGFFSPFTWCTLKWPDVEDSDHLVCHAGETRQKLKLAGCFFRAACRRVE